MHDIVARYAAKNPEIDFSNSCYRGCREPLTAVCKVHGEITKPAYYWNIYGCPECGRASCHAAPKKTSHFSEYNNAQHAMAKERWVEWTRSYPEYFFDNDTYVKEGVKLKAHCLKHGLDFTPTPKNALAVGTGCEKCRTERISSHKYSDARKDRFVEKAAAMHKGKYDYSRVVYKGRHTKVEILCPIHGAFMQKPHDHLSNGGCCACGNGSSVYESELQVYLDSLGAEYEVRNRTVLEGKEIDILIENKKVGFEINGLFWHTEEHVGKLHQLKYERATAKGYKLFQIYEDDWIQRRPAVENRVKALLGLHRKIYARKTTIKNISSATARAFLGATHLQGSGAMGGIYYGLYENEMLVAVATFSSKRTGAMTYVVGSDYELLRFASSCAVVGGFSRLLSRFVQDYNPSSITSYCDLNHSDGSVYRKNGFVLASIDHNQYWWLESKTAGSRTNRYATQKHKLAAREDTGPLIAQGMTEVEACEALGWRKIIGAGVAKWLWTPSPT